MSAQTEYLRQELNNAKAALNNESLRRAAVKAIDKGLSLLESRDDLEDAGVVLPAMDTTIVAAIYDPIKTAIDARNGSDVAIKDKATILTELASL
jgi:hypothetical protein